MTWEKITEVIKTPVVWEYFGSLIGVAYDSNRERSLSAVLLISSLFLTIASGYTTFQGMKEYVPTFIALLMTLGVQGLLFAVSWRIGVALVTDRFKYSLFLIYTIAVITSVFFSYSSLLNVIYKPSERKIDELERSKHEALTLTSQIINRIKVGSDYDNNVSQVRKGLYEWQKNTYPRYIDSLQRDNNRAVARYYRSLSTENSSPSLSQNLYDDAISLKSKAEKLKEEFEASFSELLKSDDALTVKNLDAANQTYIKLVIALSGRTLDSGTNSLGAKFTEPIKKIGDINEFLAWTKQNLQIRDRNDLESLKSSLYSFSYKLPVAAGDSNQELLNSIRNIGKYGGEGVHQFVLSIGALRERNILAIGALSIAIFVDVLVLLCGLLGARPDSILAMRKPEDLEKISERALETVLSINLDRVSTDDYVNRIINILKLCKPDIQSPTLGVPAIIEVDQIQSQDLAKELAIFTNSGLVIRSDDNTKFILSTRLILWMADEIIKCEKAAKTSENFKNSARR